MAAKTALNERNLRALGAERLAKCRLCQLSRVVLPSSIASKTVAV